MSAVPTVFVVDDDGPMRGMLRELLYSAGLAVETYPGAREFLAALDSTRPGCIITDLRMPGMSGIGLQQHLASRGCLLPFVVLSGHGDIPTAAEAFKAGAVDFLEKPVRPQQLLEAVFTAIRRNEELRLRESERATAQARLAGLTAREREVLDLLVAGQPNKIVAARLGISHNTVENHRAAIMRKTGTEHVAELVRLVVAAGPASGPSDPRPT